VLVFNDLVYSVDLRHLFASKFLPLMVSYALKN